MKNARKKKSSVLPEQDAHCGVILARRPVSDNQMQNTHVAVGKAWNLRVHTTSSLRSLFGLGSRRERGFVVAIVIFHSIVPELWET